ncbi:hypothetical protein Pint_04340 [Pistacia integerrima]|uniref:Uncharacterized protein n=1 Tax=Pistacia integerrima TaxID=434235 RepID=A0ACC0Z761_9ROSI|nr:hypothetical protein Pint_04340 [Pistacia integerrima]
MSLSIVSAAATSVENTAKEETNRRSANYHPSIWGDHFLSYASDSMETDHTARLLELKEEIRKLIIADMKKPAEKLDLIDAIQSLGVSYHFETEVDEILSKVYKAHQDSDLRDDLYSTSLEFRLLRQHGYNISCDIFNKFKDSNGKFKASLEKDVRGMLSLYEATHRKVHGENILDEALAFTTAHLESIAAQLSPPVAVQVKHAIRKGLQRIDARHYMCIFQEDASQSHNEVLLAFAKLEFIILQKMHQIELSHIAKVIECYFWIVGVPFEPEYSLARRILTKVITMAFVIDNVYDVYGTIEELELFTEAIERWDVSAMDQLPGYMKLCYQALLDVYSETEKGMADQGRLYRLHFAKEAMKTLVRNYFYEAKWCHKNYVPSPDEYMTVALVTSGYPMLATTSFVGMGNIVTKEAFEWLFTNPKMIKASSVICRLMDDMVSHKFEQKRGHVASSIECFMIQHGATEEEARNEFQKQVIDAWNDINEECLRPTAVPMPLLDRILNPSRVIDVIYKDEDGYTHAYVMLKDLLLL